MKRIKRSAPAQGQAQGQAVSVAPVALVAPVAPVALVAQQDGYAKKCAVLLTGLLLHPLGLPAAVS